MRIRPRALGRFYDVYAFRLGRPEQRHVAILFNDITERKTGGRGCASRFDEELKAANAFLDAIIENIPLMLFIKESQSLRFIRLNRAGEDLLGWPNRDVDRQERLRFLAKGTGRVFRRERSRDPERRQHESTYAEEPIQTRYHGVRILHTKKFRSSTRPVNPMYLLGISEDITERRRIEKEQQFLAEVSVALSASLEYEQTLATLARLVVQNVADWSAVDVMDEEGQFSRLKVASADPDQAALCARSRADAARSRSPSPHAVRD